MNKGFSIAMAIFFVVAQSSCAKPLDHNGVINSNPNNFCWVKFLSPINISEAGEELLKSASYLIFDESYENITYAKLKKNCDNQNISSIFKIENKNDISALEDSVENLLDEKNLKISSVDDINHGNENPFTGHPKECYFNTSDLMENSVSFSSYLSAKTNLPILLAVSSGGKTKVLLWKDCNKAGNIATSFNLLAREFYH